MVIITVEAYKNAQVHTVTVGNKELFWVKISDVQNGLGIKNISDVLRKEIQAIYQTQNPAKEQIKKHKRSKAEIDTKNVHPSNLIKYARSDIEKKNCKGVKKCNNYRINKVQNEKNREDFRNILGFKENDIYERKEYCVKENKESVL